ncbi:MFS general substrate transporter [Mycena kentingensis (nom. inval.)]|nr:MFS general substrate transporter [Mycena kentingensis (nom. inval.)]
MAGGFGPSLGPSAHSDPANWAGEPRVLGPRWLHLPILTIGLLAVQVLWSTEMAFASPYLVSLGLSTSHVALVFLAGPISGLVVQPFIGAFADVSTSSWGRRRPYIILGCVLCVVGMLLLGYTKSVAGVFTQAGSDAHRTLTTGLAVVSIFLIDFSVNAVQAVDRALVVDTLPPAQQTAGNACAALMLGVGSVLGFFIGNLPLQTLLPFLHADSELQALSAIVSFVMLAFHLLTTCMVRERVLLKSAGLPRPSLRNEFREIIRNIRTLPPTIRQICVIQFFAWLGWFPVLFYTTLYFTDLYFGSLPTSPVARAFLLHLRADDAPEDIATRYGARAYLLSAILALATNALLPFLLPPNDDLRRKGMRNSRLMGRVDMESLRAAGEGRRRWTLRRLIPDAIRLPLPSWWAASHLVFSACMVASFFTHSIAGATILIGCTGFSWGITQWAPFSLLAEAILTSPAPADARTRSAAAEEEEGFLITRPDEFSDEEDDRSPGTPLPAPGARKRSGSPGSDSASDDDIEFVRAEDVTTRKGLPSAVSKEGLARGAALLGNPNAQLSVVDVVTPRSVYEERFAGGSRTGSRRHVDVERAREDDEEDEFGAEHVHAHEHGGGGLSAKAGVILGIHNISIVVPQFLITGLTAIILAIFDADPPPIHPENTTMVDVDVREGPVAGRGRNSVVIIFRLGGLWAAVAFVLAWRLARELRRR